MRKLIVIMIALLLLAGTAAAEEGILGKAFPDFTVTDTQGNSFTLSEALKDHEAVLINIWATWCPPCEREFPDLNNAFEQYGDRVAFIALSCEDNDTPEKIEEYRTAHGITFPMGRDEAGLMAYTGSNGIPVTVIVDRFGNAVFERIGSFNNAGEITRTLDAFLGESYTETVALKGVPADTSTRVFPVAANRALVIENENVKPALLHIQGEPDYLCYVIPDDTVRLRPEITAADQPENLVLYDAVTKEYWMLPELLDPERNAYVCEKALPGADREVRYFFACLEDMAADDPDAVGVLLFRSEDALEELAEAIRADGYEAGWEYTPNAQAETVQLQAYILHAADQYGNPVPGVYVNFCTDTACVPAEADEDGIISFTGAPDRYHVQILEVPDGYGFDAEFELYTDSVYGEWLLRIRKDGGVK